MKKMLIHIPKEFDNISIIDNHLVCKNNTCQIFRFPLDRNKGIWNIKNTTIINDIIEIKLAITSKRQKNIFCKLNIHEYEHIKTERVKGLYTKFNLITRNLIGCKMCGKTHYKYSKNIKNYSHLDLDWIEHKP